MAAFGGSWSFIVLFGIVLAAWVSVNAWLLPNREVFDPYPSSSQPDSLDAGRLQAPVIMMSQKRQSSKDRLAAANDYEVNLKAELEIMTLHEEIDDIRMRQVETLLKRQNEQIEQLRTLMARLDTQAQAGTANSTSRIASAAIRLCGTSPIGLASDLRAVGATIGFISSPSASVANGVTGTPFVSDPRLKSQRTRCRQCLPESRAKHSKTATDHSAAVFNAVSKCRWAGPLGPPAALRHGSGGTPTLA